MSLSYLRFQAKLSFFPVKKVVTLNLRLRKAAQKGDLPVRKAEKREISLLEHSKG